MKADKHEEVWARKWQLDFDELTGRATPPDRLEEILRRHEEQQVADIERLQQPRSFRLGAAAMVFLSIGLTVGVGLLLRMPEAAKPAVLQKQGKQGEQKRASKNGPTEGSTSGGSTLGDSTSRKQGESGAAKTHRADKARPPLRAVVKPEKPNQPKKVKTVVGLFTATMAREQELQKELQDLKAQIKRGHANKKATAELRKRVEQLQARQLEQRMRNPFEQLLRDRGRVNVVSMPGSSRNPLLRGEYGKALRKLASIRQRLLRATKPADARKVLDEMTRTLDQARLALWRLEKAGVRTNKGAEAPEKRSVKGSDVFRFRAADGKGGGLRKQ